MPENSNGEFDATLDAATHDDASPPEHRFAVARMRGLSLTECYKVAFPHKQLTTRALAVAASNFAKKDEVAEVLRVMREYASGKMLELTGRVAVLWERDIIAPLEFKFGATDDEIDGMNESQLRERLRAEIRRGEGMAAQLQSAGKKPWFELHLGSYEKCAKIAQSLAQAVEGQGSHTIVINMPMLGENVDKRQRFHKQEVPIVPTDWRKDGESGRILHYPSFLSGQEAARSEGSLRCTESPKYGKPDTVCFCAWQEKGVDA